jgi:hypothetical protein
MVESDGYGSDAQVPKRQRTGSEERVTTTEGDSLLPSLDSVKQGKCDVNSRSTCFLMSRDIVTI